MIEGRMLSITAPGTAFSIAARIGGSLPGFAAAAFAAGGAFDATPAGAALGLPGALPVWAVQAEVKASASEAASTAKRFMRRPWSESSVRPEGVGKVHRFCHGGDRRGARPSP